MDALVPSAPEPMTTVAECMLINDMSPSFTATETPNGSRVFHFPPSWTENGLADSSEPPPSAGVQQQPSTVRRERRHKAPTLSVERWGLVKARIISLHIVRKFPLTQVKARIESEFGFTATLRQFRTQISKWNLDRNVKAREMSFIVMKRQHRKLVEMDKRDLVFQVRNQKVLVAKIERWMKRNQVSSDELYVADSVASTPDGVSYRTASDRGSPSKSSPGSPENAPTPPDGPMAGDRNLRAKTLARTTLFMSEEEERLRTKLAAIEQERGKEHPDTLRTLSNLGMVLFNQGQLDAAQAIFQRLESQIGDNGIDAAETLGNLGVLMQRRGHYQEAEEMLQRASYLLIEHGLSLQHVRTLNIRSHLAMAYLCQGQWVRAEALQRALIREMKQQLGPHHPGTLKGQSSLALILITQSRWKEAEELEAEVIEARKTVLGPDHPNTLTSIGQLALAYCHQGQYAKAIELQVELVKKRNAILGQEHPDTVTSMSQLASTYRRSGQWLEAEALQVEVVESRTKTLGAEHPEMLNSMTELALTYVQLYRWDEAERLQVQALETRKRVLGAEHPDTITSMSNLACSWMARKGDGRDRTAIALMEECVEVRRRILGPDHAHTAATQAILDAWKGEMRVRLANYSYESL